MMPTTIKQTAGRTQLGDFAPTFAELNDDVLFGKVWSRTEALSLRDRSFLTLVSLISQGLTDASLEYHMQTAKQNGITRAEIAEIITQVAFYAGWPKAWAAFRVAKIVWSEAEDAAALEREAFLRSMGFPLGEPNTAYAQYFTGQSHLAMLSQGDLIAANVTFEPGCRNHWHIHHGQEQVLFCVAGRGWYQEAGKPAQALNPGDTVTIAAGVKHWHGAAANSWFAHIAVSVPKAGASVEWLEPVSDEYYSALAAE